MKELDPRTRAALLAAAAAALGACSGDAEAAPTAAQARPASEGGEQAGEARVHFDDLSFDARKQYMQDVVLPEMSAMFAAFDADEFGDMDCATCHGDDAREVRFEMPNDLHPLDPEEIPAMFASSEPIHVFMTQQVWPRMTELLGEQPYDPATHEGFGCLDCHATAE